MSTAHQPIQKQPSMNIISLLPPQREFNKNILRSLDSQTNKLRRDIRVLWKRRDILARTLACTATADGNEHVTSLSKQPLGAQVHLENVSFENVADHISEKANDDIQTDSLIQLTSNKTENFVSIKCNEEGVVTDIDKVEYPANLTGSVDIKDGISTESKSSKRSERQFASLAISDDPSSDANTPMAFTDDTSKPIALNNLTVITSKSDSIRNDDYVVSQKNKLSFHKDSIKPRIRKPIRIALADYGNFESDDDVSSNRNPTNDINAVKCNEESKPEPDPETFHANENNHVINAAVSPCSSISILTDDDIDVEAKLSFVHDFTVNQIVDEYHLSDVYSLQQVYSPLTPSKLSDYNISLSSIALKIKPDVSYEHIWTFPYKESADYYDSDYFSFSLHRLRLTLSKDVNIRSYSISLTTLGHVQDFSMACSFTLHGYLKPDISVTPRHNYTFTEVKRYHFCRNFIGDDLGDYADLNGMITITVVLYSNLDENESLVGCCFPSENQDDYH